MEDYKKDGKMEKEECVEEKDGHQKTVVHGRIIEELDPHFAKIVSFLRNNDSKTPVSTEEVEEISRLLSEATTTPRRVQTKFVNPPKNSMKYKSMQRTSLLTKEQWDEWHALELDLLTDDTIAKRYAKRVPVGRRKPDKEEKFSMYELKKVMQDRSVSEDLRIRARELLELKQMFSNGMRILEENYDLPTE